MATDRDVHAFSVRIPRDLHEDLRLHRAMTGVSANELVLALLTDYMDGPGRERISRGMTSRAKALYGEALRELGQGPG